MVVASGKKIDISKQGLNSIDNKVVKLNLMGRSETMAKKDWVDPQGRKGKVRIFLGEYLLKHALQCFLSGTSLPFSHSAVGSLEIDHYCL